MKWKFAKISSIKLGPIEIRLGPESDLSKPAPWLYEAFGGFPTSTGITVTEENSLQFSAVYACVNVIADQLAAFPKGIFKMLDDRTRKRMVDHPLYFIVDREPNEFYSAFDFWHAISKAVLLWGNGFAKILRDSSFNITGFMFIHPRDLIIRYGLIDGNYVLFYEYLGQYIPSRDMLHFKGLTDDGVQGQGVIRSFAKESIGLSVAAERFGAKFFGNDTIMTKYLSHPAALSEQGRINLQNSWQQANAGLEQSFKMKVLEEGMKLENVVIPPEQAQFIATRQHQVEEICRWFKVQPHLIQHLLRSTNNNIEQQSIEFVTHTLTPWVVRFEHELNRKIFTEKEKQKFYIKFNMNSLLRGDTAARTAFYNTMFGIGAFSANDIRALEDQNPREDPKGDEYFHPLNLLGSGEERPQAQAPQPKQDNTQNDNTQKDDTKEDVGSTEGFARKR
jgi:HK97 family phage portal protein